MKSLLMCFAMGIVLLFSSCQGTAKKDGNMDAEKVEQQAAEKSEEKAKEMGYEENGGTLDLIEMMKKGMDSFPVDLSEDQLNQIDAMAAELGLSVDLPSSEFKAKAKELRKSVYDRVFTDEQRAMYDSTAKKNVFKK